MLRPPQENNKHVSNELNETLSKAVNSYENIIVIEDLNIDGSDHNKDRINYLSDFVDTFSLYNLVDTFSLYNLVKKVFTVFSRFFFVKQRTKSQKKTEKNGSNYYSNLFLRGQFLDSTAKAR